MIQNNCTGKSISKIIQYQIYNKSKQLTSLVGLMRCKRKRSFKKKTEYTVETRTVVSKSIFYKEMLSLSVRHGVNTSAVMHLCFCSARLRDPEFIFHFQKLLNSKM